MKRDQRIWIIYLIMLPIFIVQMRYRFNHPEKTETELFLDFLKRLQNEKIPKLKNENEKIRAT